MKRYNNIYNKIYSMENLIEASKKAKKNKNKMKEVNYFLENQSELLLELQKSLKEKTFTTSEYKHFSIVDKGKKREISDLPYYPDRIVHWALMLQIEHIFLNHFIFDTYAAIPKKGGHLAIKRIKKRIEKNPEDSQYCLKIDIKKFFPNIDQDILKKLVRKKIKDKDLLWLIDDIITSIDKGVPIGNYLSQYLGNYYFSFFDHWCKETLKLEAYWRYMDDVVILHKSKEYLHDIYEKMVIYLKEELKLEIKKNWQVFPTYTRGIDFIGYRIFQNYSLLRKSTAKNFKIKMKKFNKQNELTKSDISSIFSYRGWLIHCNSYNLYNKYIQEEYNEIKKCKQA